VHGAGKAGAYAAFAGLIGLLAVACSPGPGGSTEGRLPDGGARDGPADTSQDLAVEGADAANDAPDDATADALEEPDTLTRDGAAPDESIEADASTTPSDAPASEQDAAGGDATAIASDAATPCFPGSQSAPGTIYEGTASLSGTEASAFPPGSTPGCAPLATAATSTVLEFWFTYEDAAYTCSFRYEDAAGNVYSSEIQTSNGMLTEEVFPGGTYRCTASFTDPLPGVYAFCPELGFFQNGISGSIDLSIDSSTGAVSLSRSCTDQPPGCAPLYGADSSVFTLQGSLTCADSGH